MMEKFREDVVGLVMVLASYICLGGVGSSDWFCICHFVDSYRF